jgi:PHP family Zn ribbon phosphoesterase
MTESNQAQNILAGAEEYLYDLHIHSCLSPCGDNDATPADIAGLAAVLGLQIAALTDHNTCRNCSAFFAAAENYGILPIAGMELTTAEEIHVLCLFGELSAAMAFSDLVYDHLPKIENNAAVFGEQILCNADGEPAGTLSRCLINATDIGIYDVADRLKPYGGIMIPAHIERAAFSLIASLGYVPEDCGFSTVEIRSEAATDNLKSRYPYLNQCKIIHNSDAHRLEDLPAFPDSRIALSELSAKAVISVLKQKDNNKNLST